MTNEQILKKAIEKAVKNGFQSPTGECFITVNILLEQQILSGYRYYGIIFSHNFAKAFFGKEELFEGLTLKGTYEKEYADEISYTIEDFEEDWLEIGVEESWAWHLKQMVLQPEPLKYLEKFL